MSNWNSDPSTKKIHKFINNFKHLYKEIPDKINHDQAKVLETLIKEIQQASIDFLKQNFQLIKSNSFKGQQFEFIPKKIKEFIEGSQKYNKIFKFKLLERKITIHMYTFTKTDDSFFYECLEKIFLWLYVATKYSSLNCSKELHIYIYFTEYLKYLPEKNTVDFTKEEDILQEINVNTGFTTSCQIKSEITIFRKEEWFKVFIHETLHNLGLDFSSMNIQEGSKFLFNHFPIKQNILCFETYCEVWAEILYIIFVCFFKNHSDNKDSPDKFELSNNIKENNKLIQKIIKDVEKLMQKQILFSIFQCVKVLKYNNLDFIDLYKKSRTAIDKRKKYKENVEVLSYYVFKSVLLYYYNDFIRWCIVNNSNIFQFKNENILKFCHFITLLTKIDNKDFLKVLKNIENINSEDTKKNNYENLTLRMTLY